MITHQKLFSDNSDVCFSHPFHTPKTFPQGTRSKLSFFDKHTLILQGVHVAYLSFTDKTKSLLLGARGTGQKSKTSSTRDCFPGSRTQDNKQQRSFTTVVQHDEDTRDSRLFALLKDELDFQEENQPRAAYIGRTALVPIHQCPSQKISKLKIFCG